LASMDMASTIAARAFLQTASLDTERPRASTDGVTSLTPAADSVYRTHMLEGERRFRTAEYSEAFNQFKLANGLARSDAESLLSMLHARFALAIVSYSQASHYLQEALRCQPELPLIPLRIRGFYGNTTHYVDQLFRLEQYVKNTPEDAEAQLILAYYSWFDPDIEPARTQEALARAFGAAKVAQPDDRSAMNARLLEAIDVFWRGMVASGKVEGELKPIDPPTLRPTPTDRTTPDEFAPAKPAPVKS
jgi:hypothetical protein